MMLLLGACNSSSSKKVEAESAENDSILITKTYHSNGGLWKVSTGKKVVKDGETTYVMDGERLEYYRTPQNTLSSKAIYKNGKRNGLYIKYYIEGNIYYQVNYLNGKMDGVKQSYHKNKQLMAETPYKQSLIGTGTKEYTPDGKLITPMTMKVWYKKDGNATIVYAQALNKGRVTERVEFFEGALSEGKYSHNNLQKATLNGDIGMVTLYGNPSTVTISAKIKSARNNYSLVSKTIQIK